MKVDMSKLVTDSGYRKKKSHKRLMKSTLCVAACLALAGFVMVRQSMLHNDNASADAFYDESEVNPTFTVQHVGDVTVPNIYAKDGTVTVLGNSTYKAALDDDGKFLFKTEQCTLYDEYETTWNKTDSLAAASFLNGVDGSTVEGYRLKEVWFGDKKDSKNESDFLVLDVTDLSHVTLTNNPKHPGLSESSGGRYVPDADGNYIVCIHNSDVIRLVFGMEDGWEYTNVSMFDYDVSDGGYYLEDDYYHRKSKHETSGQASETGKIYIDAIENGIHLAENYTGDGPKFAFGGAGIGTDLANEALVNELDTINVHNYGQQKGTADTGVTKGLIKSIGQDENLIWADGISHSDLFGKTDKTGKTCYTDGQYSFTFATKGFSRTLSAVESDWGTCAEDLDKLTNTFWIMDGAPSYGTDGHDPVWGNGSENILYYKSNDRYPDVFGPSIDELDHNSFFGFSCTKDFTLSPGYAGPLEFFGYSDDDMWVFAGRVDSDGKLMTDTVVSVADLGGVHDGAGYYCNLWDVIDKVAYGSEAQNWRLFMFWLERDGVSASCYLNFTLPEAAIVDGKTTGSVLVEAADYKSVKGAERIFMLDDGTHNCYKGTYSDGSNITVISGKEFEILSGLLLDINGLVDGTPFTIKETGRPKIWVNTGDKYDESDTASCIVGSTSKVTFVSAVNSGMLSIAADAEDTPEGGYVVNLILDDAKSTEVSAMDGYNNPIGSRFTNDEGKLPVTLAAGEVLTLYDLPEGTGFRLEPDKVPGWHMGEILLDGATVDGTIASGEFPAYVVYRYERNKQEMPQVTVEQSVTGDWDTQDIVLGTDALISYKVVVTNPNDVSMDVGVDDMFAEGLTVMESSVTDSGIQDGQKIHWDVSLDPYSTVELSFTAQVTATESMEFDNHAQVIVNNDMTDSNTVRAFIP